MNGRVTIGDFSRASHLSVKTLRHYHEVGLLEPSEVDPGNGYRYYSEEQIAAAQVIRRLRGLQMPVAEVKSVLATSDSGERNRLIMQHLDRLEADLAGTAAAVAELRALISRPQAAGRGGVSDSARACSRSPSRRRSTARTCSTGGRERSASSTRSPAPKGLERAAPPGGMYASEIFQHGRGQATVFIPTDTPARQSDESSR